MTQRDVNLWFEFDKKVLLYIRDSDKEEYTQYLFFSINSFLFFNN